MWRHLIVLGLLLIQSFVKATLIFETNSEFGIFMAIATPLSLKHRNVFLSFSYEFNYYQPEHIYKYPPILMGDDWQDSYLTYSTTGGEGRSVKNKPKRSLTIMSRTNFYTMLKDKLERTGYPAEACLLRLICETNASTLGEVNGFLGNLVHIIFTPSTSRYEHLSEEYYEAEWWGSHQQDCSLYVPQCRHNVLDLISKPLDQLLRNVKPNKYS
ncbi:uncharacterized protein Dwil_GK21471 [Drosophila willistoni]|nr:uncharacterized protein Dwil_GK21471 [Drosophila willistoni]